MVVLGIAAIAFGVLVTHSLKPEPVGGVVAVVNNHEVTREDLQAEAAARGVPLDRTTTPALLKAVLDRKLLAQAATREKLDELPNFPSEKARAIELALARQKLGALDDTAIHDVDAQARMRDDPQVISGRSHLAVHQVAFAAQTDGAMADLSKSQTLEALKAALRARRIPWRESDVILNGAALPDAYRRAVWGLTPGEVLLTLQAGAAVAVAPAAPGEPSSAQFDDMARIALRDQRRRLALERELAVLYRNADITYQSGYASPP